MSNNHRKLAQASDTGDAAGTRVAHTGQMCRAAERETTLLTIDTTFFLYKGEGYIVG